MAPGIVCVNMSRFAPNKEISHAQNGRPERIIGNAAYLQTGLIQAFVAARLVNGEPRAVGFQGASKIVGHRELLAVLQAYGFCSDVKIETI
jgi:hypothetical protein